jgi:hypothetical protein
MPSNLFKIEAIDLQKMIAPHASRHEVMFKIGDDEDDDDLLTSDAIELVNDQEAMLLSQLSRSKYRKLMNRIDGEVLTWASVAGQTIYKTSFPTTGNLKIWVDYFGGWEIRSDSEQNLATRTVSGDTITFAEPFPEGSRIVVEYDHASAHLFTIPKSIVLKKTVVEIYRRYNFQSDESNVERFTDWERQATAQMLALAKGEIGIIELDTVPLIYNSCDGGFMNFMLRLKRGLNGKFNG